VASSLTITCSPASGSTFGINPTTSKTTTVSCTAADPAGNTAAGSFTATVQDTTPPVLSLPGNLTVNATGPSGATITYTATATDIVDVTDPVTCMPASGSLFAIGTTTVTCSATDAHGNTAAPKTFTVTVENASQQVADLLAKVRALVIDPATRNNLISLLQNTQASLSKGDTAGACDKLTSFISQVQSQSGKKIAKADADALIVDAQRVKTVLGCV
jgi:hypothetical protein